MRNLAPTPSEDADSPDAIIQQIAAMAQQWQQKTPTRHEMRTELRKFHVLLEKDMHQKSDPQSSREANASSSKQSWVVFDSGVHPEPLEVSQGLPQGDPGSCVVMATMMLALKKMVDLNVNEDGQQVYQAIYMDDRTAVAKTDHA